MSRKNSGTIAPPSATTPKSREVWIDLKESNALVVGLRVGRVDRL